MPRLVWRDLTAGLWYGTSTRGVALADALPTVSQARLTRLRLPIYKLAFVSVGMAGVQVSSKPFDHAGLSIMETSPQSPMHDLEATLFSQVSTYLGDYTPGTVYQC
jgi:hypothetical protein